MEAALGYSSLVLLHGTHELTGIPRFETDASEVGQGVEGDASQRREYDVMGYADGGPPVLNSEGIVVQTRQS